MKNAHVRSNNVKRSGSTGQRNDFPQEKEILQLILPTLRADFELTETYNYTDEILLDCPLSILGGTDGLSTPPEQLLAWNKQTNGTFRFWLFPGDHFFLSTHQTSVLRVIKLALQPD